MRIFLASSICIFALCISIQSNAQFSNPQVIIDNLPLASKYEFNDVDANGYMDLMIRSSEALVVVRTYMDSVQVDTLATDLGLGPVTEFANMNGDAFFDLIMGKEGSSNDTLFVFNNDGDGNFSNTDVISFEDGSLSGPNNIYIGDFNGDAFADYLIRKDTILIVTGTSSGEPFEFSEYHTDYLLAENIGGTFSSPSDTVLSFYKVDFGGLPINHPPFTEYVENVDGDLNDEFIVFSNYSDLESTSEELRIGNFQEGSFEFTGHTYWTYTNNKDHAFLWADNDDKKDLLVMDPNNGFSFEDPEETYVKFTDPINSISNSYFKRSKTFCDTICLNSNFCDVNNDGHKDFVTWKNNSLYYSLQVYQNEFSEEILNFTDSINVNLPSAAITDFNQDGAEDILYFLSGTLYWLENVSADYEEIPLQSIAFWDENQNGIFDIDEFVLDFPILLSPENHLMWGDDYLVEPDSTYALSAAPEALWNQTTSPDSFIVSYGNTPEDSIFYFGFEPIGAFVIQENYIAAAPTRCNETVSFWLNYENKGTTINDGFIELIYDSLMVFASSDIAIDSTAGNKLYWFYEDLAPWENRQIHLQFEMPGTDFAGDTLHLESNIQTWDGNGNHKVNYPSVVLCSYDPNDKMEKIGLGPLGFTLLEEDTLQYTIRFQNTGNDTAHNLYIQDQLSDLFDWSTVRPIAASHEFRTELNIDSGLVTFYFDDIYLPDSNVNEPASHGFVTFEVGLLNPAEEEMLIENEAQIFFDFNPPILTNTTKNTFVSEFPISPFGVFFSGKVLLEGPYRFDSTANMYSKLISWYNYLPSEQPFNQAPYHYDGNEVLSQSILPSSIYYNIVDWILIELRTGTPDFQSESGTEIVKRRAAFLLEDGSIYQTDGQKGLTFFDIHQDQEYHVCIRHRNHLDIISSQAMEASNFISYDFSVPLPNGDSPAHGEKQLIETDDGYLLMHGGDINGDGLIQITDYDIWISNPAQNNGYFPADCTLNGDVDNFDADLWLITKAKLGSPEIQY